MAVVVKGAESFRLFGVNINFLPASPPSLPTLNSSPPSLPTLIPQPPSLPTLSPQPPSLQTTLSLRPQSLPTLSPLRGTLNLLPPSLPTQLMHAIHSANGTDLLFLTNKEITVSDVNPQLNRLFIPNCETKLLDLLTKDEKRMTEMEARDGGVKVIVVDSKAQQYSMIFKKWKTGPHVLIGQWKNLVQNNKLKGQRDSIELWSFRVNSQLCFAINIRFGSQSDGASSSK